VKRECISVHPGQADFEVPIDAFQPYVPNLIGAPDHRDAWLSRQESTRARNSAREASAIVTGFQMLDPESEWSWQ